MLRRIVVWPSATFAIVAALLAKAGAEPLDGLGTETIAPELLELLGERRAEAPDRVQMILVASAVAAHEIVQAQPGAFPP